VLCATLLAGCVSTRVIHVYDEKCRVMTRKMELTLEKADALEACSNHDCVTQVIGGAISVAASAIVSGSVALVGNVAFWLEKSANCKAARTSPPVAQPAPPARAASTSAP
jgi:hypothetical protein